MKQPKLTPDQIAKAIRLQKDAWIDSVMKKHLPKRVYEQMHRPAERRFALGWLRENGYRVYFEEKGHVIVKKGTKTLAQCDVVIDCTTPEQLNDLATMVKHHR